MFVKNTPVYFHIPVTTDGKVERIPVPGITSSDEYIADRISRTSNRPIPTAFVDVVSYHDVPADRSRNGIARKYYKHQRQSATFMTLRTERVPELDEFSGKELLAKVDESAKEIQLLTTGRGVSEATVGFTPKADFGAVPPPIEAPAAAPAVGASV